MLTHDFLSIYPAKLAEYALAIGYMAAFVGWWRFVNGGRREAEVRVPATAIRPEARRPDSWFTIPEGVWLHPGHSWARAGGDGLVAVGVDDFAQKLVGPVTKIHLPKPGAPVAQGVPAIALASGERAVPLLSPIDGVVAEVNEDVAADPSVLSDPYAQGWLFKVRPARLQANRRQLLSGEAARRWLDGAAEALAARVAPELGQVLQDGGVPVSGIAHEVEPERWDTFARSFFLT